MFCVFKSKHKRSECRIKPKCKSCEKFYPNSLHRWKPLPNNTLGKSGPVDKDASSQKNIEKVHEKSSMFVNLDSEHKSSIVLPVMVKKEGNSEEIVIYALLDNQRDSSFISETTANTLELEGKKIKLSLSTMSSKNKIIDSTLFDKIQVRGYNCNDVITLSSLYSREAIPLNVEHYQPLKRKLFGLTYLSLNQS